MRTVVIGMIFFIGLGSNADASCAPTAILLGSDEVVAAITPMLSARGIATEVIDGCPYVRATITASGAGLLVTIEDPYGRAHGHLAGDVELAATVIESWVDPVQEAPLLAARGWSRPTPKQAAIVDEDFPRVLVRYRDPVRTLGGSVALESSLGSDGSTWWGAAAATCVRLGRTCVGANLRLASDAQISGSSEKLETGRTALDLLLVTDVPIRWGNLAVTFGGGVGVGWIRSSVVGPAGAVDIDTGGLRADAHALVEFPITGALAVELRGSVAVSPLAHVSGYLEDGSMLAGEPRGFARLSLGLRYGAQ